MKKKKQDYTTLALLAAAAIAIYFATRPKQQGPALPPGESATSGLPRRPLHDVA